MMTNLCAKFQPKHNVPFKKGSSGPVFAYTNWTDFREKIRGESNICTTQTQMKHE